jgi:acyl carrier protein
MKRDEIEKRVVNVTAGVLRVDPEKITLQSHFVNDLGAESVQSIELMASFEEEFDVELDEDEALAVQTVGGAVDFIEQALNAQGF